MKKKIKLTDKKQYENKKKRNDGKENGRVCAFYYLTNDWLKEIKSYGIDNEVISYLKNIDYKGDYGVYSVYNSPDIDLAFIGLGNLLNENINNHNNKQMVHKIKDIGGLTGVIAKGSKCKRIVCNIPKIIDDTNNRDDTIHKTINVFAREITFGIYYSTYEFNYKFDTKKKDSIKINDIIFISPNGKDIDVLDSIMEGRVLADNVNYVRELTDMPSNMKTPEQISRTILKTINRSIELRNKISVKMLKHDELKRLGMNGVLAVAQGSANKPVVMILEYGKKYKNKGTFCLVGKGVTFDSGGISIKPSNNMDEMKGDMAGAAAVAGGIISLARFDVKKHVIGLLGFVENMPSGAAQRPGDVISMYNNKTIEVKNTDAEGRLVLSDLLAYASRNYNPDYMLDFATLTGAVITALGHRCAGVMGNDDNLISDVINAGIRSGDRCWQLPLWDDYDENIESKIADYMNIGSPAGAAGSITAAMLLKHFTDRWGGKENKEDKKSKKSKESKQSSEEIPWVHVDIAGTAWYDKKKPFASSGATGFGVRLIYELIKGMNKKQKGNKRDK